MISDQNYLENDLTQKQMVVWSKREDCIVLTSNRF
jgi:hypothetical protein